MRMTCHTAKFSWPGIITLESLKRARIIINDPKERALLAAIQPKINGYHDGDDSRVWLLSPATAAQNPPPPADERFYCRRQCRVSPKQGPCDSQCFASAWTFSTPKYRRRTSRGHGSRADVFGLVLGQVLGHTSGPAGAGLARQGSLIPEPMRSIGRAVNQGSTTKKAVFFCLR